jgi:hypothetical protein
MKTNFKSFLNEDYNERGEKVREIFKTTKIDNQRRNKINKELNKLLKITYFTSIPLDEIFDVLKQNDIVPLQEDNTEWSGLLCGREGRMSLELGDVMSKYKINDIDTYTPLDNTSLVVTWYYMGDNSKKYEVIAYVA